MTTETIGVGITTRNRSFSLGTSLRYFAEYSSNIDKFVIVDDSSTVESFEQTKELVEESSLSITLRRSNDRLGISKAKNACLAALKDCDHIFLFDDDIWPIKKGWEEYWVNVNKDNGLGHSMWIVSFNNPSFVTVAENESIKYFQNCMGVLLYFSKQCIANVGGYDTNAPSVYGYEHAQMSLRAHRAGFTGNYPYVAPSLCGDYLYSVDISLNHLGQQPPLGALDVSLFSSSVLPEEVAKVQENSRLMEYAGTYIALEDPLGFK